MDEGDIEAVEDSQVLVASSLEDDSTNEGPHNELLQMQRIRELDMEPLEEEEADSEAGHSLSDNDSRFLPSSVPLIHPLLVLSGCRPL